MAAIVFNSGYDYSPHKKANPIERGTIYSGNVASFDGSNDYINLGTSSTIRPANITISLWINTTTVATDKDFVSSAADAGTNGYRLGASGTEIIWLIGDASSYTAVTSSGFSHAVGSWRHIVATYDGANLKIYTDGALNVTGAATRTITHASSLYIGGRGSTGGNLYAGKISNVQIWDTALTLAQVIELYTQPELILPTGTTSSSLKGHWLLNEGSGFTAYDQHIPSGVKKFGETSVQFPGGSFSSGQIDTADALQITDSSSLEFSDDDFTIEAWLYPTASGRASWFCQKGDMGFGIDYSMTTHGGVTRGISIFASSNGSSWGLIHADSGGTFSSISLTLNDWNHVAVVREGAYLSTYINGVRDINKDIGASTAFHHLTADWYFGGSWHYTVPNWEGYIDEMRISDSARYTGET